MDTATEMTDWLDPAARAKAADLRPTRIVIGGSYSPCGDDGWLIERSEATGQTTLYLNAKHHARALELFPGIPVEVVNG